jgi:hypothetical protein
MELDYIQVMPNASSLIESMRSIGYTFEAAIADIIDNSISADSNKINIFQRELNGEPYIQIIDDGIGMEENELIEAMRLGSKNPNDNRDAKDLGRFGLGLKSASFSQCRVLTVISKKNNNIAAFQWDLDTVRETNKFEIRRISIEELSKFPNINILIKQKSGTIVQWGEFDRVSASSSDLQDELSNLMDQTREHIALVFHRFLTGDELKMAINFEKIEPKDPFLVKNPKTQELKDKIVKIDGSIIHLYPYVLPHYSNLTSVEKRLSGKVNEQYKSQGFYIYRNKRLIIWGDYLGLSRKTELGKNTRIQVDIPNTLDYLWEIDVKKSRASVPAKIKKNLLSAINDGNRISKKVNTFKGNKELVKDTPIWQLFAEREGGFHLEINTGNPMYKQLEKSLNKDQLVLFKMFSNSAASAIPVQAIYSQISDGKTVDDYGNEDNLLSDVENIISYYKDNTSIDLRSVLKTILFEEPYASNKKIISRINATLGEL